MVDKIVKFKNNMEYLILDEAELNEKTYYLGIKVNENDTPTSIYLFFERIDSGDKVILSPVWDDKLKGLLLTAFTTNFVDMSYEEGDINE